VYVFLHHQLSQQDRFRHCESLPPCGDESDHFACGLFAAGTEHSSGSGGGHGCRERNDTGRFGHPGTWLTEGLQPQRDDGGSGARGAGAGLVTESYLPS